MRSFLVEGGKIHFRRGGWRPVVRHQTPSFLRSCFDEVEKTEEQCYREIFLIGYKNTQIYDIVADVERYPAFLPWCSGAEIHNKTANKMIATLRARFLYFQEAYTSEVSMVQPKKICATLRGQNTLLRSLRCDWCFKKIEDTPLATRRFLKGMIEKKTNFENSALITFDVSVRFRNQRHKVFAEVFRSRVVEKLSKSFEERCKYLFGPPEIPRLILPHGTSIEK